MPKSQRSFSLFAAVLCLLPVFATAADPFAEAKSLRIVLGEARSDPEAKAADLLQRRLLERSHMKVAPAEAADVLVVLGTVASNPMLEELSPGIERRFSLPISEDPHPEAFAVQTLDQGGQKHVLICGSDVRGVFYGVGAFLRSISYAPDHINIPSLELAEHLALIYRGGTPTGPGSRAIEFGDLRPQTEADLVRRMEDLILVGANIIGGDLELVRSYGMQSYFGRKSNELPGEFPTEWGADNGRSTRYICPSVPEARAAVLAAFDKWFQEQPEYEIFATKSGDPGGCRCDRCEPWGATYIKLTHEVADILHKYHPNTKVIATNQDLSNEGNAAIFEYLNKEGSDWLYALRYGPGADEMQTYIRGDVNPRWFEYSGFGPLGNYLKWMHHELPRETRILGFTDVTHWMQAQYAVEQPDVALAAVYDRRAWNARPRNFHRVAQEIFHYLDGDIYYSEGQHDDFNKWFYQRMMWNPHLTAEQVTEEYCQYFFGEAAAPEMAQVIFLMEETLEKPVLGNEGIARAVELARSAGEKIPENYRNDHRWHIIMQKALMDRYIQLMLERGGQLKTEAAAYLEQAAGAEEPGPLLKRALAAVEQPLENKDMKALREEALKHGERGNELSGYREPAPYIAGKYDLTEVEWWAQTLRAALEQAEPEKLRQSARMILHYEDPGEGGYYDDLGWPAQPPHLTHGETLWGFRPFFGPAKRSHYGVAYDYDPRGGGVQLDYQGLDPQAEYVVRISLGGGSASRRGGGNLLQVVKADDNILGEPFAVPAEHVEFHEFDIARELTNDGKVHIELAPVSGQTPMTTASEVWLMRKDKMPWSARR